MKDAMDALPDLANPRDNLVSRLGILGLDLTTNCGRCWDTSQSLGRRCGGASRGFSEFCQRLQTGDVIHSVNQTSIDSLNSLRAALRQIKPMIRSCYRWNAERIAVAGV